jgi:hypothetical protein
VIPPEAVQDAQPAWAAVKRILADRLPYTAFMERIAPTSSVDLGGPDLLIAVQNEHHRWWLEAKLGRQIRAALDEAGYANLWLRYLNFPGVIPPEAIDP